MSAALVVCATCLGVERDPAAEFWADVIWHRHRNFPCADDFKSLEEAALACLAFAHREVPARVYGDLRISNIFARLKTAAQDGTL